MTTTIDFQEFVLKAERWRKGRQRYRRDHLCWRRSTHKSTRSSFWMWVRTDRGRAGGVWVRGSELASPKNGDKKYINHFFFLIHPNFSLQMEEVSSLPKNALRFVFRWWVVGSTSSNNLVSPFYYMYWSLKIDVYLPLRLDCELVLGLICWLSFFFVIRSIIATLLQWVAAKSSANLSLRVLWLTSAPLSIRNLMMSWISCF